MDAFKINGLKQYSSQKLFASIKDQTMKNDEEIKIYILRLQLQK